MIIWLTAWIAAGLLAVAATATGEPGKARQKVSFELTEKRPNRVTGERFLIDYVDPANPSGKPAPARVVSATLPRGARIDTTVPAACPAGDDDLKLRGPAACPAASRIGRGVATAHSGFPPPAQIVTTDVDVFNTRGGFVAVATVRGAPYREILRFELSGRTWTVHNRPLPGNAALKHVDIHIFAVRRKRAGRTRNYITTPRRCPKRRYWRTKMRFRYDKAIVQDAWTRTPCKRPRRRR
jgi:hypothetical protein